MQIKVNKLYPDVIYPFKFQCGVIYKAVFDSIYCSPSFFGVTEEGEVYWIDCKKDGINMSMGGIYTTSVLGMSVQPCLPIEEFEQPDYDVPVGALNFLMRQSEITGKKYQEVEIIYG